jgi:hypothetical protein
MQHTMALSMICTSMVCKHPSDLLQHQHTARISLSQIEPLSDRDKEQDKLQLMGINHPVSSPSLIYT